MIRAERKHDPRYNTKDAPKRAAINPLAGEFAVLVGGELQRFDTRLATVAAIEAACGDRPIAEILNGIVVNRRARDVIPLLAAALATADPPHPTPEATAARASVGEAEAFVLALIFALGFTVRRDAPGDGEGEGGGGAAQPPLDGRPSGEPGGSSPLAP